MECNIFSVSAGFLKISAVLPFRSLVYELKYRDSGSFQAVFPRTAVVEAEVKIGRFASILVEPKGILMYIYSVKMTDTEVWAYGYEFKELLNKCAMLGTGEEPPEGETSSASMLYDAITALFQFSWHGSTSISGISGTLDPAGIEYYSLLDFIIAVCEANNAGFMVYRDSSWKGDVKIYSGTDKSDSVVFSRSFGTLRKSEFVDSDADYVNKVIAIGTDGVVITDTAPVITGETYSLTLDLRQEMPRDEETSLVAYADAVRTRARLQRLSQSRTHKISFGDIDARDYGSAYVLGDIVGVYDDSIRDVIKYRVVTVKFTIENNGLKTKIELEAI